MVQLRNLIYDTYKCMANHEIKLNGRSFRALHAESSTEGSAKGEILNLLYSLENYAVLVSWELCLRRHRLQPPQWQLDLLAREYADLTFMIRQAMSEKAPEIQRYLMSVQPARALLCRRLVRFQHSFFLLWLRAHIHPDSYSPFDFTAFKYSLLVEGIELTSPRRQVVALPLPVQQVVAMLGY
jgi:hypothetical protein